MLLDDNARAIFDNLDNFGSKNFLCQKLVSPLHPSGWKLEPELCAAQRDLIRVREGSANLIRVL